MSLSRRHFFRNLGLGSAGLLSTPFIIGRGHEAMAFELAGLQPPDDGGFIRISSNENARGPGRKTMDALRNAITPRVGRGYPPDYTADLVGTIAETYGVGRDHVIVGTGSGPILEGGTRAFCASDKPLVTAAPTYGTPDQAAKRINAPVKMIRVDRSLGLDLDAMADAATGAGMIFFCNPNNPTGTVHNYAAVEQFVRKVKQRSPQTKILIDEAYIDYVHDPGVKTAVPLATELPGVFVTRSYSKAHGMAGLRLGYAIGQPETLKAISGAWNLGSVNTLTAAAGIASLRDAKHIEEERRECARARLHAQRVQESRLRRGRLAHQLHLRRPETAGQSVPRGVRRAESLRRSRLPAVREDPQPHHARHDGRDEAGGAGVQASADLELHQRRRSITSASGRHVDEPEPIAGSAPARAFDIVAAC